MYLTQMKISYQAGLGNEFFPEGSKGYQRSGLLDQNIDQF